MRVLFLDCFSGISGDMTVGALCDLGVKPSTLEWELSKLEIGDFHMHFERKQRQAIEGIKFSIHEGSTHTHDQDEHEEHDCCGGHDHGHGHSHSHGEEGHSHSHAHSHEHGETCCNHDEHGHTHSHAHDHSHAHGETCCNHGEHSHDHAHTHEHTHAHEHSHDHAHAHKHDHCCGHNHGEEGHEHGHHHHHEHAHAHDHGHGHSHEHGDDHVHGRNYAEIRALIENSDLTPFVKKHSLSIFHRVAVAEGKIHGKPPEEVGFHEVGALDSIADIICACVGIETLGIEKVYVSPLNDGRGWVDCAHGRFPIPAAATLEILTGIPVGQIDEPFEFITPTGAAIVAEFGESFGTMPRMKVEKIGYGIGTRKIPSRPNVLRAVIGEIEAPTEGGDYLTDTIARIETNLDDVSSEITGATMDKLFAAGALDVFLTSIHMKKNRPGVKLTVLCEEAELSKIADLLFAETTSFGLRIERVQRWKLDRKFTQVRTPFGPITLKIGLRGKDIVQAAPEFESCREASERTGKPLRMVYEAAMHAWAHHH